MVLSTRRQDRATTNINTDTSIIINQIGSMGAPKASPVKEALLTLRTQLQAQLESGSGIAVPEMHANTHANLRNVRRLLNQVDTALVRIDQRKYGICSDCSRPVEGHRMVMEPYSTRCTSCQTVADWRGLNY